MVEGRLPPTLSKNYVKLKIMYYFSLEIHSKIRFKKIYNVKIENVMKLLYVYMGPTTYTLWPSGPTYAIVRAICVLNPQYFALNIQNCVGANTQPILVCDLRAHWCGWNFLFGRSLGSKFCMQSSFYMRKQAVCRVWMDDIKKIDAKSIFTVPHMMSNLAIMPGAVNISAVLISFVSKSNK